jgi:hypothetical protein
MLACTVTSVLPFSMLILAILDGARQEKEKQRMRQQLLMSQRQQQQQRQVEDVYSKKWLISKNRTEK